MVVGIDRDTPGPDPNTPLLSPDQRCMLDALGDQAAVSIERIALAEDIDRSRLFSETERLRAAMLTSISHDLRTPLSAILGAVSTLQNFPDTLDTGSRTELMATIADEAERMGRFVANLLDMTRLESGAVTRHLEPIDLSELIGSTLTRAAKMLAAHTVALDVAADLPLLALDGVLLEQVLFNLLDNAVKCAPAGTTITIRAWWDRTGHDVKLQVIDEGPGIPPDLTGDPPPAAHRSRRRRLSHPRGCQWNRNDRAGRERGARRHSARPWFARSGWRRNHPHDPGELRRADRGAVGA